METEKLSTEPTALHKVKEWFETWREVRKKLSRIPEELWQAAVELSSDYSLNKISLALTLDYSVLKERILSVKSEELSVKGAL